jgi:hypothetical protein
VPHRILEAEGLFDFSAVRDLIEPTVNSIAREQLSPEDYIRYLDLVMLTASEAELAYPWDSPFFLRENPRRPIIVGVPSAYLAIQKWNSTPTWPHIPGSDSEVRLWDVILYAGDMSKVAHVAGESVTEVMSSGFTNVVERLKTLYREAENEWARALGNGTILDYLGVLWHAKCAVLLMPPDRADQSVQEYIRGLPGE